jgi:outer membrane protein, multidrug efflux system
MRLRPVFALVGFTLLASATASAQTQPQPLPNVEGVNLPPPPTVDDPDLRPLPPAKHTVSSWSEIASYLRARSADLRIAIDEVGRAEAQRRVAWAGVLGTITASGGYTHNFLTHTSNSGFSFDTTTGLPCIPGQSQTCPPDINPTPDYVSGSINAQLPIIAPRAWNAIHISNVNVDVQRATLEDIKHTISTTVAGDALRVVTNERLAELNRVGLRQALERLELAKRKTSLGAGTGLDVIRAQQDVETARSILVTGDENAREAREQFGIDIGVAEDVGVAGDLSFEAITRQLLSQCKPAPTIEERTDVTAARERVHLARVNTWDVKTQFFPTLTLSSTAFTTTQPFINPATTWNISALVSWNIWEGGARYGNLRDAQLQVLEAQDRLDAVRRTAVIQVVQTDRGVAVAQQSRDVAERSRNLAAEVDRLTRAGFMTGQGTSLDLVTAAASLRQAEINLAISDANLIKARILAVLALSSCPL